MSRDDIVLVDEDSFDRIVRVDFAREANTSTILEALYVLVHALRRGKAANRFEELLALEITPEFCEVRLRYFTDLKRKKLGLLEKSGYDDTLGPWFVRYVFAKVNSVYKIEKHPFYASDLSVFLEEPEPFDGDPEVA
jgi:hypothetical protein